MSNLIPASKCRTAGLKVVFGSNENHRGKCVAQVNKTGNIPFVGVEGKENGLYDALMRPKLYFSLMLTLTEKEKLWHDRLGHANIQMINETLHLINGIDMPKISSKMDEWPVCLESNWNRPTHPYQSEESKLATKILDFVQTDIQGPMKINSYGGAKYFMPLMDNASGLSLVRFMSRKSEDENTIKTMIKKLETRTGKRTRMLKSHNGTEVLSSEFQEWLKWNGIIDKKSAPYSPASNENPSVCRKHSCTWLDVTWKLSQIQGHEKFMMKLSKLQILYETYCSRNHTIFMEKLCIKL